jgi:hypothetical protein
MGWDCVGGGRYLEELTYAVVTVKTVLDLLEGA